MKEEMRLAFFNKRFLLATGIMLVCFLGIAWPSWVDSADWGDIYRPTALEQTLGGIFFGGVMLMMPFCASFPYATSQVDELRTNYFYWKVMRIGVRRYVRNKAMATALSGAGAMTIAYLLNAVIWHIIAMPYDPLTYENQKIYFSQSVIWHNWDEIFYATPIYLWIGFGIFITSAIWTFFGLTTAIWIPDKVLCTVIPVCIYHLWMAGFTRYAFGIQLASPEALFNDGLTIEQLGQSLVTYGILLILTYALYYIGVERRSKHG